MKASRFLPVTEAKNRLLHPIREIDEKDEVPTITRGGVQVAVLLSPDHYAGLLETIEVLADRQALRSPRRSIAPALLATVGSVSPYLKALRDGVGHHERLSGARERPSGVPHDGRPAWG